jgi:phage RecT family recombinase
MNELIQLPREKSVAASYRARRADDRLAFAVEKRHLAAHIERNNALAEASPESFADVLLQAAGMGLSLNPALGHCYVIPYRTNGQQVAQFMPGYRGLLHNCHRASTVQSVQAVLVHEKDPVFKVWTDATGRQFMHEESRGDRGRVTHAYCLARFTNGGHHLEVMSADELQACEDAARKRNAKGGAVWRGPFRGEMMKKAVMRRAWKWWPQDPEGVLARTIAAADEAEPMDFGGDGPQVCINDEQALALHAKCIDAGMDDATANRWMERLPKTYGYASLKDIPAEAYARVERDLAGYIKQWRAAQ